MQAQGKGAKNKKTQKSAKKPKTRAKDDSEKGKKNRLKTMEKGNNNGMGKRKQEQNKRDIRTMM